MILAFIVVTIIAILGILFTKSHKLMSILSMLSSGAFLTISIIISQVYKLPVYYLEGNYFFIDSLALFSIMLASLIFFLSMIYSYGYIETLVKQGEIDKDNLKLFYMSLNMLFLIVIFAFISNNIALFWILVEISTFFSTILIILLNQKENLTAGLKYILITSSSMLFTFIGVILLFTASQKALGIGSLNWGILLSIATLLPAKLFVVAFIFLMIGFAAKSGLVPFHGWIPHAYSKAPSIVSSIMSTTVSFLGIYGILRITSIAKQTLIFPKLSLILISLGVLSIAIAAFIILTRRNLKKMIGFSSVENTGIAFLMIGIGTPLAIFWLLFHILVHSLTKVLLFLSSGILHLQYKNVHTYDMKNVLKMQKIASIGLIIGGVSLIGFPLLPLFISKLYMLIQIGLVSKVLLFGILLLFLVGGAGIAWVIVSLFTQTTKERIFPKDILQPHITMIIPIILIIIALFVLGVYFPEQLKNFLEKIVSDLMIG